MDEDMVQRPSCFATAALPSMHWRTAFGGVLQQWCKIKYSIPQYCFARHWHCTESSSIECTGTLTGGRRVTYAPRSVSISPTLLPYCSFSASYSTITQPSHPPSTESSLNTCKSNLKHSSDSWQQNSFETVFKESRWSRSWSPPQSPRTWVQASKLAPCQPWQWINLQSQGRCWISFWANKFLLSILPLNTNGMEIWKCE